MGPLATLNFHQAADRSKDDVIAELAVQHFQVVFSAR